MTLRSALKGFASESKNLRPIKNQRVSRSRSLEVRSPVPFKPCENISMPQALSPVLCSGGFFVATI